MTIYNVHEYFFFLGVLFSEKQTSLNFHFDSCEDGVRGLKLSAVLITLELKP